MEEGAKMELGSGKPLHNSTDNCYGQMIFDVFSSVCTTLPHHSGVGSQKRKSDQVPNLEEEIYLEWLKLWSEKSLYHWIRMRAHHVYKYEAAENMEQI